MNHTDISRLGGASTSKKKARAARRNARKPRPARREFNHAVRKVVEFFEVHRDAGFHHPSQRDFVLGKIVKCFPNMDMQRAQKVYAVAIKRIT